MTNTKYYEGCLHVDISQLPGHSNPFPVFNPEGQKNCGPVFTFRQIVKYSYII